MIFVQGQALDNRSEDPFVLDGAVVSGWNVETTAAIEVTSRIRMRGYRVSIRETVITRYKDQVAVEVSTDDVDTSGRPAPLLVTLDLAALELETLARTVNNIGAAAVLMGRTIDTERLRRDLEEWRDSPKATRGPLIRRYRNFMSWLSTRLAALRDWLAARGL